MSSGFKKIKLTHNIYIDGSYKFSKDSHISGVGVYDSNSGYKLSLVENCPDPLQSEHSALSHAIKYATLNNIVNESRIFTDCEQLSITEKTRVKELGFIDLIWIPRELNTIADALAGSYKNESTSVKRTVKISKGTSTLKTTTTIKSKTSSLNSTQIIKLFKSYPLDTRIKLLTKIAKRTEKPEKDLANLAELLGRPHDKSLLGTNTFRRFAIAILGDILSPELKKKFLKTVKPAKDHIGILLGLLKESK